MPDWQIWRATFSLIEGSGASPLPLRGPYLRERPGAASFVSLNDVDRVPNIATE